MRYLSMLSCAFSCRANPATNRDIGGLNSQAMNKAARPLGVTARMLVAGHLSWAS